VLRGANEIVTFMRPLLSLSFFHRVRASLGLSPNGTWDFLEATATNSYWWMSEELPPGCVTAPTIGQRLAIHRLQG